MTSYRKLLGIASLVTIMSSCTSQPSARETFVRNYLQKYPEATLQDIYKGNFQDVFGPAHLLTDRDAVINYITEELATADTFEEEDYSSCGWQRNFFQVNLKVIKDGRVSINDFVDAFMAGANGIDTTLTQGWLDEWKMIQQAVRTVAPDLEGFAEDSTRLAEWLEKGNYVVHHSQKFDQHYRPHYRIIRKDLFEEKILPNLVKK